MPAEQSAINAALAAGSVVVVAAGNEGQNAANVAPGNCAGVITVHATNRAGGHAPYSNVGATIEVSAPGGDTSNPYLGSLGILPYDGVLSAIDTGDYWPVSSSSDWKQGTSMAAPHVAGVASLVLSVNPALTPAQVGSILETTARPFPTGTGADCTTADCGEGIVDAYAAVLAAASLIIHHVDPGDALCGGKLFCYATAQAAVEAAADGVRIFLADEFHDEDVVVANEAGERVTMVGGWDGGFTTRGTPAVAIGTAGVAGKSTLRSLTIAGGTLRIE